MRSCPDTDIDPKHLLKQGYLHSPITSHFPIEAVYFGPEKFCSRLQWINKHGFSMLKGGGGNMNLFLGIKQKLGKNSRDQRCAL